MKAFIVIDMQNILFLPQTPRYNKEQVVNNINSVLSYFRSNNFSVIFLQHDGSLQNECLPGSYDWEIIPELLQEKSDITISKIANDCFYKSELMLVLDRLGITEILVSGCATDFCVDSTIKSAITKGLCVSVLSDGHTTANRNQIMAKDLISYYNWIWENLIPINRQVKLYRTEEILRGEF